MEQRRIILFLSLSFAILMLNSIFLAPAPQKKAPDAPAKADAEPAAGEIADEEQRPAEQEQTSESDSLEAAAPAEELGQAPLQAQENPLEFIALGSVDPKDQYRELWIFTTRGAGVRRVELASRRYRDLDDRGGYLGHLELIGAPNGEGLLVRVVGQGTPAHKAGIEVGYRLLEAELNGKKTTLEEPEQLRSLLAESRPNKKLRLTVLDANENRSEKEITLGRRPLEVIRPESENYLLRHDVLPPDFTEPSSFQFTFTEIGTNKSEDPGEELQGLDLLDSNWEIVSHDSSNVTFRQVVSSRNIEVLKHYRIEQVPEAELPNEDFPAYSLNLEIEIRNRSDKDHELVYRLDGPNGLPIEGWWYARKFGRKWGAAGLRDVVGRYFGSDTAEVSPAEIAKGDADKFEGGSMAFMGVDAQYFAAMLMPQKESPEEIWMDVVNPVILGGRPRERSDEATFANVTCRMISREETIPAGQSLSRSFTVFAGPKRPELLANYQALDSEQYSLQDLLYYGWFSGVAKLMLAILHFFYSIVGNYGISIVMLTVLVRSCMLPISRKQMQSMARMQELKPEMEKIKVKYKSDPQKQSQAMQELYRKHNINPLAGCLPMFIQLPIFVGLYRSLAVDVELRQAPLISESIRWCSNLGAPDMLYDWSGFMPDWLTHGMLGPYLNVLPLATAALFIVQQKLTMPPPADEQAALQQKIMQYMMVFFAFMFYKVASGLCLYFIASSLWGLAERKLWPAPALATANASASATAPPTGRASANGEPRTKSRSTKKKR